MGVFSRGFLALFLLVMGVSVQATESDRSCEGALSADAAQAHVTGERIRQRMLAGSRWYGERFKKWSTSMFRGTEYQWLAPEDYRQENSHMLYIGAGGDVFRPIVDFPLVKNYHFLDTWNGWGSSSMHVFLSIKHRLEEITGGPVVVEELGFLKDRLVESPEVLLHENTTEMLERLVNPSGQGSDRPLVLRFEVYVPGTGQRIQKKLWLHRFDMARSRDFDALLGFIPAPEPVVGILQAGLGGTPHAHDWLKLLNRLSPEGWYLLEQGGRDFESFMAEKEPAIAQFSQLVGDYLENTPLDVDVTEVYDFPAVNGVDPRAVTFLLRKKR